METSTATLLQNRATASSWEGILLRSPSRNRNLSRGFRRVVGRNATRSVADSHLPCLRTMRNAILGSIPRFLPSRAV